MCFSEKPNEQEEKFIIDQLWDHNKQYNAVDIRSLVVTKKNDKGEIIAGLIARTWWGGLEIQYLWVDKHHRKKGFGKQLMEQAEKEAANRGCHFAYVDTFSFQAQGFYHKLGYREYGELSGFVHKYTRYFLSKKLPPQLTSTA